MWTVRLSGGRGDVIAPQDMSVAERPDKPTFGGSVCNEKQIYQA